MTEKTSDHMEHINQEVETPQNNSVNHSLRPSIGAMLQNAREIKGYSLKKISHHTKISLTMLKALEEDDIKNLPNKAYVIGFIKSYANVVDLKISHCLDEFEKTFENLNAASEKSSNEDFHNKGTQKAHKSYLLLVSIICIGVILSISAYLLVNSNTEVVKVKKKEVIKTENLTASSPLQEEIKIEVDHKEIIEDSPTKFTVPKNDSIVKKEEVESEKEEVQKLKLSTKIQEEIEVKESEKLKLAEKKKVLKESVKKEAIKKENEKSKKEEITFKKFSKVPYRYASSTSKKILDTYIPKNMQAAVIANKQNVFINAHEGDTWITYKKDNAPIKQFTLKQGKTILIRGDVIRLFLGRVFISHFI